MLNLASMPTLPNRLAVVRAAVASLLRNQNHAGSLYSAEDIVDALNAATDFNGNAAIDVSLLLRAFANDAADEFVLAYDEVFGYSRDKNVLFIQRAAKVGRHEGKGRRRMLVGRFSSMETAMRAVVTPWHIAMDEKVRAGLVGFLEEESRKKKKQPAVDVSPDDTEATDENYPPQQPLVNVQPRQSRVDIQQQTIHYTLEGRAGKIAVPSNGLLLVRKLRENLEPLTYTDTNKTRRNRINKRFRIAVFGCVSLWVPVGASLVRSNHLSRLQKDSAGICRFYSRFNGKRCKLSATSMRVLTAFGLHNSGGSDEGTTTAIAAAFWVASNEMGKPLTPEQLGCGSPSESLLCDWEKRYAAECFILKYFQMKKHGTKYLHCWI